MEAGVPVFTTCSPLLSFMLTHRTVPERTGDADIYIYVQDSRPRNQDFV